MPGNWALSTFVSPLQSYLWINDSVCNNLLLFSVTFAPVQGPLHESEFNKYQQTPDPQLPTVPHFILVLCTWGVTAQGYRKHFISIVVNILMYISVPQPILVSTQCYGPGTAYWSQSSCAVRNDCRDIWAMYSHRTKLIEGTAVTSYKQHPKSTISFLQLWTKLKLNFLQWV